MNAYLINILCSETSEILEEALYEKKDEHGNVLEKGIKYLAEIRDGEATRARYTVKIPGGKRMITDLQLDEGICVKFSDVSVSYIDTKKKEVYFKANKIIVE